MEKERCPESEENLYQRTYQRQMVDRKVKNSCSSGFFLLKMVTKNIWQAAVSGVKFNGGLAFVGDQVTCF